jgi:hypothetical protein
VDAPRIWVPKLKIVEAQIRASVGGVAGYFMIEAVRHGRVVRKLGPWKQLITNQAMDTLFYANNSLTSGPPHSQVGVGTGSPTFTNSSTGLASPVGSHTSTGYAFSNTVDAVGTDSYRERHTKTWEFTLGGIVGNLTEIGIFGDGTNTSGYFLDLIRDSGGTPTTFPATVNDQLRVTHILDRYPFLGSTTGSFTIGGGAGSGSHDYDSSMQHLTDGSGGPTTGYVFGAGNNNVQSWIAQAFRDVTALGANTAGLTGAVSLAFNDSSSGGALGTASNDGTTWKRSKSFTWGLTTANHANGISGLCFGGATARCLKVFIDPPIPKFAGSVQRFLTLDAEYGLTRV